MPNTGSPIALSAISVPQAGMPEMNDLVPSIGIEHPDIFGVGTLVAVLLADDAVIRKGLLDQIAHRVSAARSAAVTGSKLPARPLSSTPSEVRKKGRIVSPETRRELVDESRKIDRRHR